MKLYQSPGGTWAGTEKDWKAAVKDEGLDPKHIDRSFVDVPTSKAALMEFLTFHNVNVINPGAVRPAATAQPTAEPVPTPAPAATTGPDLDTLFGQAPLPHKLRLAVHAIDAALMKI